MQQWQLERAARRAMTEEMVVVRTQQISDKCKSSSVIKWFNFFYEYRKNFRNFVQFLTKIILYLARARLNLLMKAKCMKQFKTFKFLLLWKYNVFSYSNVY